MILFICYLLRSSDSFSVFFFSLLNASDSCVVPFLFVELLVICMTWLNKLFNSEVGELEVLLSSLKKKTRFLAIRLLLITCNMSCCNVFYIPIIFFHNLIVQNILYEFYNVRVWFANSFHSFLQSSLYSTYM